VRGDIRDRDTLVRLMRDTDIVFHLAAQANVLGAVYDPGFCTSTNVAGTAMVLELARAAGVRRLVFTLSREVYGDPLEVPVPESAPLRPKNAYGMSKVAGEMACWMCTGDRLEVVILRLANVYGPGDCGRVIPLFIERALRGEAFDHLWRTTNS
jgi:UDP-glucose 4-epimerase